MGTGCPEGATFSGRSLGKSIDLKEGVILHLDKKGAPLEIELIDASKFIALDEFAFLISPGMMKKADTGLEASF